MIKKEIENRTEQTLKFLHKNYWPLLVIGVPLLILLEIIGWGINNTDPNYENALISLFKIVISFFANGLVILIFIYLIKILDVNSPFSFNEIVNFVIKNIFQVSVALWIIKFFTLLGLILLIAPGIYALSRIATVPLFICFDNLKIKDAFNFSIQLSEKSAWVMFFTILILSIPAILFFILRYNADSQLTYSVFNILVNLSFVIEYVLIYFFYLNIRPLSTPQLENK